MPPAARVTDMHVCPMVTVLVPHVGGPILPPGVPTVLIDFLPAATVTSMATCVGPPDVIILGSMGVMIGGLPAARMGDMTAHGGVIVLGSFTCMIGEVGSPSPGAAGAGGVTAGLTASGVNNPVTSSGTPATSVASVSFAPNTTWGSSTPSTVASTPAATTVSSPQKLAYQPSSGAELVADPKVATTLLGRYDTDMKSIVKELNAPKSLETDCAPGKFNALNVPDELYKSPEQFWNEYNKPWLDAAIKRGDKITMCTAPEARYMEDAKGNLTGLGREVKYLEQNGYSYDPATKSMVK
jgi:uncharacterized Zn-binding protein involved in type VI secretion